MANDEKKLEKTELNEEAMSDVAGGCWLFGVFGEHDFDMKDSYPVTLPDGTRYYYLKYKCKQCDGFFYFRKTGASGSKEKISEGEFNANRSRADQF